MKRLLVIALIFLVLLVMQGCIAHDVCDTNLSNYGIWDKTTKDILEKSFFTLPSADNVKEFGQRYYYKASKSVLSDYNFVICVELEFTDEISYAEELTRLTQFLPSPIEHDSTCIYGVQLSEENALEYLNTTIYDGAFYNFEIISANKDFNSLCYVYAHVWDYFEDEILADTLESIFII